jgi:hypothetical protein
MRALALLIPKHTPRQRVQRQESNAVFVELT